MYDFGTKGGGALSSFEKRLKSLRKDHGLTQLKLGEYLGLSESTISLYESGKREPDNETLSRIADYFSVSVDYLLGRSDSPNAPTVTGTEPSPYEKENEKIKAAIKDDPELYHFWCELSKREDLQLMFKQVRDLSPASIKKLVKIIKAIEDEEDMED
jgi:transcriptional regulator with XRE-family HTH domain